MTLLKSILFGIVRGWIYRLRCAVGGLFDFVTPTFPEETPEFIYYVEAEITYIVSVAGTEGCGYWLGWWNDRAAEALDKWVGERAEWVANVVIDPLENLVGDAPWWFPDFESAVKDLQSKVKRYLPGWVVDIPDGLNRLKDWFPDSITAGWEAWEDIWDSIKSSVKEWSRDFYSDFVNWATWAWNWVQDTGNTLWSWYQNVGDWVVNFMNNAAQMVQDWLGEAWDVLSGIYTELHNFVENVWKPFKQDVHDFFDHPIQFWIDEFAERLEHSGEGLAWSFMQLLDKIVVAVWEL